jgi:hypothetical protein
VKAQGWGFLAAIKPYSTRPNGCTSPRLTTGAFFRQIMYLIDTEDDEAWLAAQDDFDRRQHAQRMAHPHPQDPDYLEEDDETDDL